MKRYDYSSQARLALTGPDRARFLHGMVTCDVEKLPVGAGSRAAMLSVKGRLLATLVVYARPEELLLCMEGALGEKVRALFDKHIVMDDVEVHDRAALAEVGYYGDDAIEKVASLGFDASALQALAPYHQLASNGVVVARDPSLGGVGFRVIGDAPALRADELSDDERELLRIEAGTARYGQDLDEERLVVEANLEDAISFDKGCYLGQEVVVRATTRGRVNRKLMGLVVSGEGSAPPGKLRSAAQPEAGLVTSSVDSPHFGGPIALAYVHRAALDADQPLTLAPLRDGDAERTALPVSLPFEASSVAAARARLANP
ncbi:MAG: glycine cleavage T C-terminal barrel domain-containing protein [Polyangia bacterium]